MNHKLMYALGIAGVLTASGCSVTQDSAYIKKLEDAVARADITLAEAISMTEGVRSHAALNPDTDQFVVKTVQVKELRRVVIAFSGEMVGDAVVGSADAPCGGGITLLDAVNIAVADQGGDAISVEWEDEDDEGCMYEVKVLTGGELWEVEVNPSGEVVETELDDDHLEAEDDD